MPVRHVLLALAVVAIWGFNFVVIKLSVDALPPLLAAALRFLMAAVPAVFFVRPPKAPWPIVVGFGLAFGVALYSFLNISLFLGMPAGLASLVLQVQAFFTILIAYFVLGDRPSRMQIAGGAIAFFGIAIIASERLEGASLLPFALTLVAAFSWGIANVLTKKAGQINPISFTVWGSLVAPLPLIVLSLTFEGPAAVIHALSHPSWYAFSLIAFLAYPATLFGLGAWSFLLRQHPASVVAPFTLLVPITGLLAGYLILGEPLTLEEIAGGAFVIAGLAVTIVRRRKPRSS
mgnify:CR=1 FL=1